MSASVSVSVSVSLWLSGFGFGLGLGLLGASLLAEDEAGDVLSTPAAADTDEVFWLTTVAEDPVLGIDVGTSSASSSSSGSEPGAGAEERRVLATVIVAVSITVEVVSSAAAEEVEKPDAVIEPTAMELFVLEVAAACDGKGEEGDEEGMLVGGAWEDGGDNIGVTGTRIVEGEVTRVEKSADGPEGTALDAHDDASAGIAVLVPTGGEDIPI